ncbi:DUF928 domain-containing protein [Limnofasciculus baicalensis]|uniref:DUF928 domain-containing protein n=1 Tax=Limnofasciculus baicalensis BBK-W-15 TaxID=2699891 RepID=A0AAE3KR90_9CYAN|nr:DUF928 domain-containing protein [Limnofasciculus baicalensis]MCP2731428.1 DUF928 domain-containing protein [Limnofasciculus baicalensis BBK-W-15]
MNRENYRRSLQVLSVGLSLKLILIASLPIRVQAQSIDTTSGNSFPSNAIASVTFDPPGNGKPRDTVGGASRDSGICPQDAVNPGPAVTPVMPINEQALTVAEHPTFFVYIPQTSAQKAMFVLRDDNEDYYYKTTLPIPTKAGVVSFKLPADAPALKSGKKYKWSFVLMCTAEIRPDSPWVEGEIQRIEPKSGGTLDNLSSLERAALYGKNGIWYDTLASLAEERRSQPDNLTLAANWENLLKSVGLGAIASQPLL